MVNVLGMTWDTVADEFFFNFTDLYNYGISPPATKCSVLKLSAKIFDPIGFLTLRTVKTKILFQELCLIKVDCDNELHKNILEIQFIPIEFTNRRIEVFELCQNTPLLFLIKSSTI